MGVAADRTRGCSARSPWWMSPSTDRLTQPCERRSTCGNPGALADPLTPRATSLLSERREAAVRLRPGFGAQPHCRPPGRGQQ
ncbi:hypothetical protein ACFPM0_14880 [Pseudonocardia sulfidoxydans]|uniref:hypothetical protein n=1 Tax=Pseudonocardia sulfidoxydans TaxID=54011 RepID=UPI00360DA7B6